VYPLGDRKNKPLLSADDADDEEEAWLVVSSRALTTSAARASGSGAAADTAGRSVLSFSGRGGWKYLLLSGRI